MKGSGGNNDPNKFKNSLIERTKQAINQNLNRDNSSSSLDKPKQNNQVGHRINQTQHRPPPPRPQAQSPKEKDGPSIFDKWVEFRDKYLAGKVDSGFRKATYSGKFIVNSILKSNAVNNLKEKAKIEAFSLKDKVQSGTEYLSNIRKETNWKEDVKETMKGKLGHGKEVISEKLDHGKDVVKEKAGAAYESGKDILKDKLHQGMDVAKDALGHGKEAAKDKLGHGAEFLKDKFEIGKGIVKEKGGEAFESGKEVLKEKLSQGKDIASDAFEYGKGAAKEKLGQGSEVLKEKIGEGSQILKEKAGQGAEVLKEKIGQEAGKAYNTMKYVPGFVTGKFTKVAKRAAIFGFLGLTVVAFAYAAGNKLPQAYFEYQLKKKQLEMQNQPAEKEVKQ